MDNTPTQTNPTEVTPQASTPPQPQPEMPTAPQATVASPQQATQVEQPAPVPQQQPQAQTQPPQLPPQKLSGETPLQTGIPQPVPQGSATNKRTMILGGVLVVVVLAAVGYYFYSSNAAMNAPADSVSMQNTQEAMESEPVVEPGFEDELVTEEPVADPAGVGDSQRISSGVEEFGFSVLAPAGAQGKFHPTASIGMSSGVYLAGQQYPFGLIIEYTMLSDESAREGAFKAEYDAC